MKKNMLTQVGLDELKKESDYLKNVKRPEIIVAIQEAREQGDLSENADYDAAKEDQAQVEGRIKEIEMILDNAEIIVETNDSSIVSMGSTVVFEDIDAKFTETFKIVGSIEADPMNGTISNQTPVAQGLMGNRVGDIVTCYINEKAVKFKIKEIF